MKNCLGVQNYIEICGRQIIMRIRKCIGKEVRDDKSL